MQISKGAIAQVVKKSILTNKKLSLGLLAAIIGTVVAGILPPLVLECIIDQLTGSRELSPYLIGGYVGMLALAGIFDSAKEGLITIFGQKVTHNLRSEMCGKLTKLSAGYLTDNESGEIASRFVNDVDTVKTLFDSGIISMFADGCKVISILGIIAVKSKGLGELMVLITPLLMALTLYVQRNMLKAQRDNRVAVGETNNYIPETLNNIRMVHTFHVERYMEKVYDRYISAGYSALNKSNFYDAFYSPVIITISALLIALMMVLSAMSGSMQTFFGMGVGTAVAIISYVSQVFAPLESIGMEIENVQSALAGIGRINEYLQEKERLVITGQQEIKRDAPAIALHHVHFGYGDREILKDFSLTIEPKENVTLMGRTGVGKSTTFKLLLGLYEPWQGTVEVFGVPVRNMPDLQRARIIGYVEQSFPMIPGTIKDQITLKDDEVTSQEVMGALELVGLVKRVTEMPQGLDTPCTQDLFSQGQMQLMAIARAVVHNPPILLLDEITANLDSVTEQQVLEALRQASADRTVLSISHRVYEKLADKEKGRCVELV